MIMDVNQDTMAHSVLLNIKQNKSLLRMDSRQLSLFSGKAPILYALFLLHSLIVLKLRNLERPWLGGVVRLLTTAYIKSHKLSPRSGPSRVTSFQRLSG